MSVTNEIILEEIKKNKEELKLLIEAVEVRLTLKLEDLNRRLIKVEAENELLTNKLEKLDRKQRENNIIIFGLETRNEELTPNYIKKQIKNLVDIDITDSELNNFYPLGKTSDPPIKIEFTSFLKKKAILRNTKKLKGSRIFIANDLTEKQRNQNSILRKHLNLARGNKEVNCYIKGNRLHVNGRTYSPDELEYQEEDNIKIQGKPQSAPGTPTPAASKDHQPPFAKQIAPLTRNIQQKAATPTQQLIGKASKEVGDRNRMKTRNHSTKKE